MNVPFEASSRLSWRSIGWIVAYGASMLLFQPGRDWVLTFHETLFAEPAREFLQTGDWVIPRMGGVPTWDKPPLLHWAIAVCMKVFHSEAEWVVRLPTVFATLIQAVLIAGLAGRWYGDRIGRLTGLIQLTTFYVLFQARLAEADMSLCATVTAAMTALAYATVERPDGTKPHWWIGQAYWLAVALAFLSKGPIGVAFVGGGSFFFALWQMRWPVWRFFLNPVGWLVFALVGLSWPVTAFLIDPTVIDGWRHQNIDRFTGVLGGQENPFFYLYTIPLIALPWTPFAILGLAAARGETGPKRDLSRLLLCWFGAGMVLIASAAWKHKHYAIPAMPPMTIFAALGLSRYLDRLSLRSQRPLRILAAGFVIGGIIATGLGYAQAWTKVASAAPLIIVAGIGLGVSNWLARRARPDHALTAAFGMIWVVVTLAEALVMPAYDLYQPRVELAQRANAIIPKGAPVYLMELPDGQITYYVRLPIRCVEWHELAGDVAENPRPGESIYVVGPRKLLPHLARLGEAKIIDECSSRHRTPRPEDRLSLIEITPEPDRARVALLATPKESVVR